MATFNEKLVGVLINKNYTQADFSRLSGIPARTISDYCRGRYLPTWDHVQRMALALGISCDSLRDDTITLASKGSQ